MDFRTEHPIPSFPFKIGYDDSLFFIGSCFSDHIGHFFESHKFKTISNPYGTLFNPKSISDNLLRSITLAPISNQSIFYFNDHFISFSHQGKIHGKSKELFINDLNELDVKIHHYLKNTDYLFITFGTSFCYKLIERDLIVANCHKIPNHQFEKIRLSIDEIVNDYQIMIPLLKELNPNIKIIFTVSPVRHLSDGFHENQISKSILHLAIEQLKNSFKIYYFPSYEIILDDLRDYRFYARDLCHPAENSIEYVEEMIMKSLMTPETVCELKEIGKKIKRENHKPII